MKYAWFTVGLPEWTPEETVLGLKKEGYDGVEWRVVTDDGDVKNPSFWKGNRCTLQESWSEARFREIAKLTADSGLQVPNLGSYAPAAEGDRVEKLMAVAKVLGAPSLRVGVSGYTGKDDYNRLYDKALEDYRKVVERAAGYGLRVLAEIHMNTIVPSASAMRRFISNFPVEKVGVIHDCGNMVYEGFENYKMGLEILGPYLTHVHVKNSSPVPEAAQGPARRKWTVSAAPLREGAADFQALFTALKGAGYDGWLSIEDFSLAAPQSEKVTDNIRFLREVEKSI